MTSSEYRNTVYWTLQAHTPANETDLLITARRIFNNLGVPFPQGTLADAIRILNSGDYMGWSSCDAGLAQGCANNGFTAIGINEKEIAIIMPEDSTVNVQSVTPAADHPIAKTLSEIASDSINEMQFFTFATLIVNDGLCTEQDSDNVKMMSPRSTSASTTTPNPCAVNEAGCGTCQSALCYDTCVNNLQPNNPQTYSVRLVKNNGEDNELYTVAENSYFNFPTVTKVGHTFAGWYTQATGGTYVGRTITNITITSNHTFYARWNPIDYTVSFDTNGGNGNITSITRNYGSEISLPLPYREHCQFVGWYNGNSMVSNPYSVTANITLKARWKAIPYHVEYTKTINNRQVYLNCILCNHKKITLEIIDGTVGMESTYCGINGVFFHPNEPGKDDELWGTNEKLLRVAIKNGNIIDHGASNNVSSPCGTFFVLNTHINNEYVGSKKLITYNGTEYNGALLTINNTSMAVGGTSLFLDKSEYDNNATAYYSAVASESTPDRDNPRPRTAIAYLGDDSTVIDGGHDIALVIATGTIFDVTETEKCVNSATGGVSYSEFRELIREKLQSKIHGSSRIMHAIALDGGNSTQMAYKNNANTRYTIQGKYMADIADSDVPNVLSAYWYDNVNTMIRVTDM